MMMMMMMIMIVNFYSVLRKKNAATSLYSTLSIAVCLINASVYRTTGRYRLMHRHRKSLTSIQYTWCNRLKTELFIELSLAPSCLSLHNKQERI